MRTSLTPASLPAPLANYAHAVAVEGARTLVFCSGQLAVDGAGRVPEGVEAQAELCFANIAVLLGEAGLGLSDVVRVNAYVTDRADMAGYMKVRDAAFAPPPPASTLMIVSGFTRPEFRVEIEVVAAS